MSDQETSTNHPWEWVDELQEVARAFVIATCCVAASVVIGVLAGYTWARWFS